MDSSAPKTCVTCVHLLGKRTNIEDAETKWRCVHPSNVLPDSINLITGVIIKRFIQPDLYKFRSLNCKEQGIFWELYTPPAPPVYPETTKQIATTTTKTPVLDKLKKLKINPDDL